MPCGDGDLGVLRVAPGREGVGLQHVGHVDAGHRHARWPAPARARSGSSSGYSGLAHLARAGRAHRDRARAPVHREVEDQPEHERRSSCRRVPPISAPTSQEQAHQGGDQDPRLGSVDAWCHRHHSSSVVSAVASSHGGFGIRRGPTVPRTRRAYGPRPPTRVEISASRATAFGQHEDGEDARPSRARPPRVTRPGTRSRDRSAASREDHLRGARPGSSRR